MTLKEIMEWPAGHLDVAICTKIMGWKSWGVDEDGFWHLGKCRIQMILDGETHKARKAMGIECDRIGDGFIFAPSRDITAAWEVLEKVRGWLFSKRLIFKTNLRELITLRLRISRGVLDHSEIIMTVEPVDICRAALVTEENWREGIRGAHRAAAEGGEG